MIFQIIQTLAILGLSTALALASPEDTSHGATKTTLKPREVVAAPLTGTDGPSWTDVRQGEWDSSWFNSVGIALAHTMPVELAKCWTDTGDGGHKPGDKTTSADFHLIDKDGVRQDINIAWKNVRTINKADFPNDDVKWWMGGLQHAGMYMKGYKGLEEGKITAGNPVDAFKMLNQEAKEFIPEKNWKELFDLLTKAKETPTVVLLKKSYGTNKPKWVAILETTVPKDKEDKEDRWESGVVRYALARGSADQPHDFDIMKDDIEKVVHL